MRLFATIVLTVATAVALVGCGVAAPPEPTARPTERPTSTPRPTVTPRPAPTDAPEPTEEPTEEVEPTEETDPTDEPIVLTDPTEEATDPTEETTSDLIPVEMEDLQVFSPENGLFEILIPAEWLLDDKSTDDTVLMLWSDPANNALLIVTIAQETEELTEEELTSRLEAYISIFENETDFTMDPPEVQEDGSIRIIWSYTAEATGGVQANLLANSFIQQNGDKVSILTFGVPDDQFERLLDPLNEVLNSFVVYEDVALGS